MWRTVYVVAVRAMVVLVLVAFHQANAVAAPVDAQFTLLHSFSGPDGLDPLGGLLQSDSSLYGMTWGGGSNNDGVIFKIGNDGTGFSLLKSFSGPISDGALPHDSLIQSGSTLYGMTLSGGSGYVGTIFRIGTDGSGYSLLHSFTDNPDDGGSPFGSLTQSGSTLYGTTVGGGNGFGTIFRVGTDGSGFSLLHSFNSSDAYQPFGSLTLSGSTLYGTTLQGGSNGMGAIFRIETDGTGFSLLHSFTGGSEDGGSPFGGSLIQSGSKLYGMTNQGGSSHDGTIFQINIDGTGFSLLHSFIGGAGDGKAPSGSLMLSGTTLYGVTEYGGANDDGTIFQIETDGTDFTLLHTFEGNSDGAAPNGSLLLSGSILYGVAALGGSSDRGTIFSLAVPEPCSLALLLIGATGIAGFYYRTIVVVAVRGMVVLVLIAFHQANAVAAPADAQFTLLHSFSGPDGRSPGGPLLQSGSTLYGMTFDGGSNNSGVIFKMDNDGTGFSLLKSFSGPISNGAFPCGSLIQSGTTFYGMTSGGGSDYDGTIFQIGTNGGGYSLLHSFTRNADDGGSPFGSLTQSGSTLYGMTPVGGANGAGTIFRIGTDGSGFSLLHSFNSSDAYQPFGSLTLSGSTLYGMTYYGGTSGRGTIFRIETDGSGFNLLHSFDGSAGDGSYPLGSLIQSGSTLYGMTNFGGSSGKGTIFKIDINGTRFNLLHSFTGSTSDGHSPEGTLTLSGVTLYGVTEWGGSNDDGTVFQIGTDGTDFTLLHSFTGDDGATPNGSLLLSSSTLYGVTGEGGSNDIGTIFSLTVPEPSTFLLAIASAGLMWWHRANSKRYNSRKSKPHSLVR